MYVALCKIISAVRSGKVRRVYGIDWIKEAEQKGILTKKEASDIRELEELTEKAISVDHFDSKEISSDS